MVWGQTQRQAASVLVGVGGLIYMTSQQKKQRLKKKADKMLQEIGRNLYDECLVCGRPYTCLHHYFPKSVSYALRYNMKNCIPKCNGCHMSHHQKSDPRIHNIVNEVRGKVWLNRLEKAKQVTVKDTIGYIEGIIESLKLGL